MSVKSSTTIESEIKSLLARVEKLERAIFADAQKTSGRRVVASANSKPNVTLDFSMPIRAFVKKHGKSLSGPKKFALLVAYLTRGDTGKRVAMLEVEKNWNKLTGLLGMKFNPAHSSRARENDWVNTEKAGLYHLRPSWKSIFS